MSNLSLEAKVLLSVLAREIPSHRTDKGLHPQALWRWATHGVRCPDGRVVKLEVIRLAGRYYSSREALARFIEAQQDLPVVAELPAPARTPTKRQRASEKAAEVLETAGI
jgi:hypothetical protein